MNLWQPPCASFSLSHTPPWASSAYCQPLHLSSIFKYGQQTVTQEIVSSRVQSNPSTFPPPSAPKIPGLAYSICGSKGDLSSFWKTLRALHHPRNVYVVHLDLESTNAERQELASHVKNDMIFAKVGNVHIAKSDMVTYTGPTMVANTLHACSISSRRVWIGTSS